MTGPTNLPRGMSFPHGIEPTLLRVHPTPLYELVAGIALIWWAATRPAAVPARVGIEKTA
jgi:phosphatidylglycerol:prolipoprotein diacylglycerol transferase